MERRQGGQAAVVSEVNEYADYLLKRNNPKLVEGKSRQHAGSPKGWKRNGSVLAGKKQTVWEASVSLSTQTFHKNRWSKLFDKPLNKWTLIK
jgi:hypothetical protein